MAKAVQGNAKSPKAFAVPMHHPDPIQFRMPATVARNTKPPATVPKRATTKKSTIEWAVLALLTTLAAFAAG
eukprot:5727348-Pleurochrysis_carterae.AAC.1